VKQHVDSLICPLSMAEDLEEGVDDNIVYLEARPEDVAKESER
jgi:hypothetical protein